MDLSATKNCHCLAARKRARELTRRYDENLRPHGLQSTQFSVLAALAPKGPTPLGELADVLGLERTTLTRSVNRLEEEGWVAEAESEDDWIRRSTLTEAGREKVESAYPAWREVQDEVDERVDHLAAEGRHDRRHDDAHNRPSNRTRNANATDRAVDTPEGVRPCRKSPPTCGSTAMPKRR